MTALRVGVIGVGDFGERHIRAYARQPGVVIVGIADRNPARACEVARRWRIDRWFEDGARLIAACRPDAVSIATPAQQHVEQTLVALEQGCSVLLEKPVAMSTSEVAALEAALARATVFVQPAHILRFSAPHNALRNRIREGAIGRVIGISATRDRPRSHEVDFPGVHPALMTMVHDIDLALWISGSEAVRVSAAERDSASPLLVCARVEAADGSIWLLRTSWLLPDSASLPDRLEVFGTSGVMSLGMEPTVRALGEVTEAVDHELAPETHPGALDAEIADFCSSVRSGVASSVVTLAEAAHGVRVAEAIVASARQGGTPVDLTT
jgi:predicted dehydrogenase